MPGVEVWRHHPGWSRHSDSLADKFVQTQRRRPLLLTRRRPQRIINGHLNIPSMIFCLGGLHQHSAAQSRGLRTPLTLKAHRRSIPNVTRSRSIDRTPCSRAPTPAAGIGPFVASLIETCKLCAVEPHAYLTDIITKIVNGYPNSQIDDLLPWTFAAEPHPSARSRASRLSPSSRTVAFRSRTWCLPIELPRHRAFGLELPSTNLEPVIPDDCSGAGTPRFLNTHRQSNYAW